MADTQTVSSPIAVIERLQHAINGHDLDALAACFDPHYESTFPAHPDRAFTGIEQMHKNWTQILGSVPDLSAQLVRCTTDGETVWSEWDWSGTRIDGAAFHQRGVTIQGVQEDRITWVRLYMEFVQDGSGVDAAIQASLAGRDSR